MPRQATVRPEVVKVAGVEEVVEVAGVEVAEPVAEPVAEQAEDAAGWRMW